MPTGNVRMSPAPRPLRGVLVRVQVAEGLIQEVEDEAIVVRLFRGVGIPGGAPGAVRLLIQLLRDWNQAA